MISQQWLWSAETWTTVICLHDLSLPCSPQVASCMCGLQTWMLDLYSEGIRWLCYSVLNNSWNVCKWAACVCMCVWVWVCVPWVNHRVAGVDLYDWWCFHFCSGKKCKTLSTMKFHLCACVCVCVSVCARDVTVSHLSIYLSNLSNLSILRVECTPLRLSPYHHGLASDPAQNLSCLSPPTFLIVSH